MSFDQFNLHSTINKALLVCGYANPTPIQEKSIPSILTGNDLVASAQTGTGKTAAFILPALHRLSIEQAKPSKKPRILILTPTRELANQITQAAITYGKFMRVKITGLVGGMRYHDQINKLARGTDIIVATPGRLLDHMEQKRVDLSGIEMLILDEADRMLDMGFIDDVKDIAECTPTKRQTLLFSATLDDRLMKVIRHLLKQPVRIDLSNEKTAAPKIEQEWYKAKNSHHKSHLLQHLLNDSHIYKAIVFTATKANADRLAIQLRDQGIIAAALHGDLKQNVRNRTLDQFRSGKTQVLVATDVAARGIDVNDITHVFNYDLPKFCEDYVHRIGRTGRAGKSGIAISFVLPDDMRHLQRIERYVGQRLKLAPSIQLNEQTTTPAYNQSHADDSHSYKKEHKKPSRFSRNSDDSSPYKKEHKPSRFSRNSDDSSPYKKEHKPSRFSRKGPNQAASATSHKASDTNKPANNKPAKKKDVSRKKEWHNNRYQDKSTDDRYQDKKTARPSNHSFKKRRKSSATHSS